MRYVGQEYTVNVTIGAEISLDTIDARLPRGAPHPATGTRRLARRSSSSTSALAAMGRIGARTRALPGLRGRAGSAARPPRASSSPASEHETRRAPARPPATRGSPGRAARDRGGVLDHRRPARLHGRGRRARQPAGDERRHDDSAGADPITTEIIRNAFVSCAQDMNATLIRSSYTPIIYEGKDCSVAILDEHGDVLGQSLGLPLFLGNLEICVKLAAEMFGWDAFRPGDVFYMNDSYMTGTHLNDATIFGPIYWQDRLVGFSATRAHWLDVGAQGPGRADGLARDLPGGDALGADADLRPGRAARGHHRPAPPQRPLRLLARRRHERPGGGVPDRRGALPGDSRPLRLRDVPRGPRGDLPAVRGARARDGGRDPRRHLPAPRASSTTTGSATARSRSSCGSTSRATR